MSYTEQFSEVHELLANISPQAANGAVGEHNTGYFFAGNHHRFIIMLTNGEPGGASTIDVDVEEATTAAGAGAQNIVKVVAQQVAADAGETTLIELRTEEMDVNNDYDWLNVEVIVAVNTYTYDLKVFGVVPRFAPASVTGITVVP
jgi:hypothetical protein